MGQLIPRDGTRWLQTGNVRIAAVSTLGQSGNEMMPWYKDGKVATMVPHRLIPCGVSACDLDAE